MLAKYLGFAVFIIFAGTGIAVGYTGASLLVAYVAYLSPWLPMWMWVVVGGAMTLGVAITAVSTAGAIATMAPNPKAFKYCSSLLVLLVAAELLVTAGMYKQQDMLAQALNTFMDKKMVVSTQDYGDGISDTQLWDEIQSEMNCCGVIDYKDWFGTKFGNGTSVPDSCCLLPEQGCGQNIIQSVDPSDDIITEGCLPTIIKAIGLDYNKLSREVWLPVCAMHVALLTVDFSLSRPLKAIYDRDLKLFSL
ncbi:unnamed protein product, partial [Meganyctiphanes norvegica]